MEQTTNSVLIQFASMSDIEAMITRAIDKRMAAFYDSIRQKPAVLVKRKDAALLLGVSLPTLDAYGKHGILHPKHVGGRVFYVEEDLFTIKRR